MEMNDKTHMQKHIFGSLFLISNKLQVVLDRALNIHNITAKQWFLTAVIEEFFDRPPTLSEVSEIMGSSRQNVKQIALKLEEKGFLSLDSDGKDKRVIRLRLTEKSYKFWGQRQQESSSFLEELFKDLNGEELNGMYQGILKLSDKLSKLE